MRRFFPAVVALVLTVPLRAATPRDELLRFVPEDVGFCLVVEDLRGHAAALLRSPFYEQFRASPVGGSLFASPEVQKLANVERFLQQKLQINFTQIRDDLLGDAVVLAYRPGPPGQPDREQGLFLLRARDARLLADFLARLDDVQKQSGELQEVQEREYQGVKYVRRVEGKETHYRCLRGPVFLHATQEAMLREAIDRERTVPEAPLGRRFVPLDGERRLARLWINPRPFEADLRHKAAAAQGAEAVFLRTLLTYWQALEGVGLALGLDADLKLTLTLRAKPEQLPPAARRLFRTAAQPSELWARFPANALLTVAGRVDVPALLDVLGEFFDDSARQGLRAMLDTMLGPVLGQEVVQNTLPHLGPDLGLCVVAPPVCEENWFPHVIGAIRVRPGNGAIPADLAVMGALQAFAVLVVREHNRQHGKQMQLRAEMQDGVDVKYFVDAQTFPAGLRPAFTLKDGYLVLASAPEAVRRFGRVQKPPADAPLVRLSLRELEKYVTQWRAPLVRSAATKNHISEADADRQVEQLLGALQLFERVELSPRSADGQITLTLCVRTTRALK